MAGRDKLKELKSNTQLWVWTRQWATQTTNKVELKVQRWCWATSLPGWAPPPSVWLSELGSVLFTFFSKVNLLPTFLIPSQCLAPPPLSLFQWIFILFLSTDSCTFFWWKKKKNKNMHPLEEQPPFFYNNLLGTHQMTPTSLRFITEFLYSAVSTCWVLIHTFQLTSDSSTWNLVCNEESTFSLPILLKTASSKVTGVLLTARINVFSHFLSSLQHPAPLTTSFFSLWPFLIMHHPPFPTIY